MPIMIRFGLRRRGTGRFPVGRWPSKNIISKIWCFCKNAWECRPVGLNFPAGLASQTLIMIFVFFTCFQHISDTGFVRTILTQLFREHFVEIKHPNSNSNCVYCNNKKRMNINIVAELSSTSFLERSKHGGHVFIFYLYYSGFNYKFNR